MGNLELGQFQFTDAPAKDNATAIPVGAGRTDYSIGQVLMNRRTSSALRQRPKSEAGVCLTSHNKWLHQTVAGKGRGAFPISVLRARC